MVVNTTPYKVLVYSGRAHWDKPIEELTAYFPTREDAERYAHIFCDCDPKYRAEIYKQN